MTARFAFEDVDLVCVDCGEMFVWGGSEQKRRFEQHRRPPRRCQICRDIWRDGLEPTRASFNGEPSLR